MNTLFPNLFDDDLPAAELVGAITEAYRAKLLLNPPTPSFNVQTNPKAEAFAARIAPKDVTRLLAVLGGLGLKVVEVAPAGPDHGAS